MRLCSSPACFNSCVPDAWYYKVLPETPTKKSVAAPGFEPPISPSRVGSTNHYTTPHSLEVIVTCIKGNVGLELARWWYIFLGKLNFITIKWHINPPGYLDEENKFKNFLSDGVLCHFMASMFSGFVTTVASMPVDIAKTRWEIMITIVGVQGKRLSFISLDFPEFKVWNHLSIMRLESLNTKVPWMS